jgi:hypothetical protein
MFRAIAKRHAMTCSIGWAFPGLVYNDEKRADVGIAALHIV